MTHLSKSSAASCAVIAAMVATATLGPLAPGIASARSFTTVFRSVAPANPQPRPPAAHPRYYILRCLPCTVPVGQVNPYDPIQFGLP